MSVNRVEALKKVYYNLSQQNSKGNTVAEVLQDIYAALSEETTKQSNVTHLIDMISEYAEGGGGGGGDITFAEVTMNLSTEVGTAIPILFLRNVKLPGLEIGSEEFICQWAEAENGKVTIPLYNGQGRFSGAGGYDSESGTNYIDTSPFNLSGDIEEYASGGYIVTGDCTITGHLTEQTN